MPKAQDHKAKVKVSRPKDAGSIVVRDTPQQLAYEQAIRDWYAGKIPYRQVVAKDPSLRSYTFRNFLLDLILGPK